MLVGELDNLKFGLHESLDVMFRGQLLFQAVLFMTLFVILRVQHACVVHAHLIFIIFHMDGRHSEEGDKPRCANAIGPAYWEDLLSPILM